MVSVSEGRGGGGAGHLLAAQGLPSMPDQCPRPASQLVVVLTAISLFCLFTGVDTMGPGLPLGHMASPVLAWRVGGARHQDTRRGEAAPTALAAPGRLDLLHHGREGSCWQGGGQGQGTS